jgi:hypothetical protein
MRWFLLFVLVVCAGVGVVGFQRGWWTVNTERTSSGQHVKVGVDKDTMIKDRDAFIGDMERRMNALDEQIAEFKTKKIDGELKPKMEQLKKDLEVKRHEFGARLEEAKNSAADKWHEAKERAEKAWKDLKERMHHTAPGESDKS